MVIINKINYDTLENKINFIKKYKFNIDKNSYDKHPFYLLWKKKDKNRKKNIELIYERSAIYKCFKNDILKLLIVYHSDDKNEIKNWKKYLPLLAIGRAIGNAASYGAAPYYIKLYTGNKGYFITIRDSGNGFNYEEIIKKFNNNEKYWNNHGGGFKLFNSDEIEVSFSNEGRKIILLYSK